MIEGVIISVVAAYIGGWSILKFLYWLDGRSAQRSKDARRVRQLIKHGRARSDQEMLDEVRSDILHGWD